MFPGNMSTKKSAAAQPTKTFQLYKAMSDKPSAISAIPDRITTKSVESGTQLGT